MPILISISIKYTLFHDWEMEFVSDYVCELSKIYFYNFWISKVTMSHLEPAYYFPAITFVHFFLQKKVWKDTVAKFFEKYHYQLHLIHGGPKAKRG